MNKFCNFIRTRAHRILDIVFLNAPCVVFGISLPFILWLMITSAFNGGKDLLPVYAIWLCLAILMILGLKNHVRIYYEIFGLIAMMLMLEASRFLWTGESAKLGLIRFHFFIICSGIIYLYLYFTRKNLLDNPATSHQAQAHETDKNKGLKNIFDDILHKHFKFNPADVCWIHKTCMILFMHGPFLMVALLFFIESILLFHHLYIDEEDNLYLKEILWILFFMPMMIGLKMRYKLFFVGFNVVVAFFMINAWHYFQMNSTRTLISIILNACVLMAGVLYFLLYRKYKFLLR